MDAAAVVMISPEGFGPNAETAASNAFQDTTVGRDDPQRAYREFDALHAALVAAGVTVHRFRGSTAPALPDQVFPNNWFSTHPDGTAVLYPMLARNRRAERRADVIEALRRSFCVTRLLDLTDAERDGCFLEGTGSVVIDHRNGIGFAALSPRTDGMLARRLGRELGLEMALFDSADALGRPFYHTNVIMSVAHDFAIWCPAAVPDSSERRRVAAALAAGGRDVVEISLEQTMRFAANLLALHGDRGPVVALSAAALGALDDEQTARLRARGKLLSVPIATIERLGGGSVRCMLAEVHLPPHGSAYRQAVRN